MPIITKKTKKGTSYLARFFSEGESLYKTFPTKKEANDWLAQMTVKKSSGQKVSSRKRNYLTVNEVFTSFIQNQQIKKLAPRTLHGYETDYKRRIFPFIGNRSINLIDIDHGREIQREMIKLDLDNQTINKILILLKQIFKFAAKEKLIESSPFEDLQIMSVTRKSFDYWNEDEVNEFLRLCKKANDFYFDHYLFDLNTGLRLGELGGLLEEDFDFNNGFFKVERAIKQIVGKGLNLGPTKNSMTRYFPLNDTTRAIALRKIKEARLRKSMGGSPFLFVLENGKPIDPTHFSDRVFKPTLINLEVKKKIRFHDLRHTFATLFMANQGQIFVLQKLMGHKDIASTMIYAHMDQKTLKKAASIVNIRGGK